MGVQGQILVVCLEFPGPVVPGGRRPQNLRLHELKEIPSMFLFFLSLSFGLS